MVLKNDSGHLMCHLEGLRGTRKGNSLSSTHIPAIRLQYIFRPLKKGAGERVFIIQFLRKKATATGKFSYDLG